MPYKLRKAPKRDLYWVVNTDTKHKHSKEPLPKDKAEAQMRALYAAEPDAKKPEPKAKKGKGKASPMEKAFAVARNPALVWTTDPAKIRTRRKAKEFLRDELDIPSDYVSDVRPRGKPAPGPSPLKYQAAPEAPKPVAPPPSRAPTPEPVRPKPRIGGPGSAFSRRSAIVPGKITNAALPPSGSGRKGKGKHSPLARIVTTKQAVKSIKKSAADREAIASALGAEKAKTMEQLSKVDSEMPYDVLEYLFAKIAGDQTKHKQEAAKLRALAKKMMKKRSDDIAMHGEGKAKKWIQAVTEEKGFKEGAFTEQALRHQMTPKQFAAHVLLHPDKFTVTTVRRANFVNNVSGGGFFSDVVEKAKKTIKGIASLATRGIRKGYSPSATSMLNKYGKGTIVELAVRRDPIQQALNIALDAITLGRWSKVRRELNYDKMFHLGLVISVKVAGRRTNLIVEKNEVVNIAVAKKPVAGTEYMPVPLRGKSMQFDEFMQNAQDAMGTEFFLYDAFDNNCQDFVLNLLKANGLADEEVATFIKQPVDVLVKKLPSYTQRFARTVTDLGAAANVVMEGQGRKVITMVPKAFFKEHRDIVRMLSSTGSKLIKEAADQAEEAQGWKRKLTGKGKPDPETVADYIRDIGNEMLREARRADGMSDEEIDEAEEEDDGSELLSFLDRIKTSDWVSRLKTAYERSKNEKLTDNDIERAAKWVSDNWARRALGYPIFTDLTGEDEEEEDEEEESSNIGKELASDIERLFSKPTKPTEDEEKAKVKLVMLPSGEGPYAIIDGIAYEWDIDRDKIVGEPLGRYDSSEDTLLPLGEAAPPIPPPDETEGSGRLHKLLKGAGLEHIIRSPHFNTRSGMFHRPFSFFFEPLNGSGSKPGTRYYIDPEATIPQLADFLNEQIEPPEVAGVLARLQSPPEMGYNAQTTTFYPYFRDNKASAFETADSIAQLLNQQYDQSMEVLNAFRSDKPEGLGKIINAIGEGMAVFNTLKGLSSPTAMLEFGAESLGSLIDAAASGDLNRVAPQVSYSFKNQLQSELGRTLGPAGELGAQIAGTLGELFGAKSQAERNDPYVEARIRAKRDEGLRHVEDFKSRWDEQIKSLGAQAQSIASQTSAANEDMKLRNQYEGEIFWMQRLTPAEWQDRFKDQPRPAELPYVSFESWKAQKGLTGGQTRRENVLRRWKLKDKSYSIAQLAKITGVPKDILQEVYNRGIGAYKTQPKSVRLRGSFVKNVDAPMGKKLSKEQWAYGRVYSFLDGNPKHDNDLRRNKLKGGFRADDEILAIMQRYSDNQYVQQAGLNLLGLLHKYNDEAKRQIVELFRERVEAAMHSDEAESSEAESSEAESSEAESSEADGVGSVVGEEEEPEPLYFNANEAPYPFQRISFPPQQVRRGKGKEIIEFKSLEPSSKKTKKWMVNLLVNGKPRIVHFGQKGYEDYTTHKDKKRRDRYIERHSKMGEDWSKKGVLTPGFWSRWLLWEKPSTATALTGLRRRFKI